MRSIRESMGMTQTEFGRLIGASRKKIGCFENDQKYIDPSTARALAWIAKHGVSYPWSTFGIKQ